MKEEIRDEDELRDSTSMTVMTEEFFRLNLAVLGIYFPELSTFEVKQQKSDSFIALICDIGGNLGLYLGGSLLTVFEIFDIIMILMFRKQQ